MSITSCCGRLKGALSLNKAGSFSLVSTDSYNNCLESGTMPRDEQKTKRELLAEVKSLREEVARLESQKPLSKEDKLKLAIINRAPLTIWACDRHFKIVLWSGECEQIYGCSEERALGVNYLELFVDPPEREVSREDCIRIIDEDVVQRNFIAHDRAQDGSRRTMLGHCFRVFDEDSGKYLQAEVALEISDLQLRIDEHHTLREVGIERLTQTKRTVELLQREFTNRIDSAYSAKFDLIRRRRDELDRWFDKLRLSLGEPHARKVTDSNYVKIEQARRQLADSCNKLRDTVQKAATLDELDEIERGVVALAADDVLPGFPSSFADPEPGRP